jgi:hypothetical protein
MAQKFFLLSMLRNLEQLEMQWVTLQSSSGQQTFSNKLIRKMMSIIQVGSICIQMIRLRYIIQTSMNYNFRKVMKIIQLLVKLTD